MKKRMLIMIIALIIIFGGIFGYDGVRSYFIAQYMAHYSPPPVTVSSTKVEDKTWHNRIQAVGTLYSYQSVDISPQQSGQINHIYFHSGEIVKKGQPLIGQDVALDKQTLKSDEATLALARITYARDLKLSKKNFVSESALDSAIAQLRQAEANVAATKVTIEQKTIKAPFTGKIGIREVNLGQYVSPGNKLTSLQQLTPLRALFSVPEQYFPKVKVGLPVAIQVESYGKKDFMGKITALDSQINTDTRNFQIEAQIPNDTMKLYPGMFANITIELPDQKNVIVVPQTAITYNLYGDSVYVLTPKKESTKDSKTSNKNSSKTKSSNKSQQLYVANLKYITVGNMRGNDAVITKGLKAGEIIVTSGQLKLRNGSDVYINNSENPSKGPKTINAEQ
jgi:membrane fusion protein (multidrug efflux system)